MAYIIVPTDLCTIAKLLGDHDEKIEHYKAQIKTITEDFNMEREARTKAHQLAEDLQEEINRLKSLLDKQRQAIKDATTKRYGLPRYECDSDYKSD